MALVASVHGHLTCGKPTPWKEHTVQHSFSPSDSVVVVGAGGAEDPDSATKHSLGVI